MYCINCGIIFVEGANFCGNCGAKRQRHANSVKYAVSDSKPLASTGSQKIRDFPTQVSSREFKAASESFKFFIYSLLSFGLYLPYWAWRRFELIKILDNRKYNSGVMGFFVAITSFDIYRGIRDLAQVRAGWTKNYSSTQGGLLLLLLIFSGNSIYHSAAELEYKIIAYVVITLFLSLAIIPINSAQEFLIKNNQDAKIIYSSIYNNYRLASILIAIGIAYAAPILMNIYSALFW